MYLLHFMISVLRQWLFCLGLLIVVLETSVLDEAVPEGFYLFTTAISNNSSNNLYVQNLCHTGALLAPRSLRTGGEGRGREGTGGGGDDQAVLFLSLASYSGVH